MKKFIPTFLIFLLGFGLPIITHAAVCSTFGSIRYFSDVVCLFIDLASSITPIVAGIALLVFFWGLAKFILKADDETAREEGKMVMKWGIIALFVMVSVWGIVIYINQDLFGTSPIGVPQLPVSR